jgi:hypothetical protein
MTALLLLDRDGAPPAGADVAALLGLADREGGRRLVCRACAATITSERERVEMAGAQEHTKQNPAGFVFRIGCFRAAPGCVEVGPEVAEHSWFAGYTWQIALCGGCFTHLGWAFRAERDRFHGLVVDRLRAEGEGEPPSA